MAIVADVDEHTADEVRETMRVCVKEHIEFYVSNIDFEVWLLMHFEDMTKWIERDDLIERLSNHLRRPYEKGASIVADDDMIDNAVRRGMKDIHVAENAVGRCLLGDRSRTTVHLLVNRLSDYA
ncbi:RloB domain-containing protein [Candidatus Methanarcanum hacksteinii]|uniref:RloB domain-containing protein n=1 Tax=Candidatus Methanarcanum hacksteinii TaxID=2911857 RepID=UPI0037DC4279